MYSGAYDVLLEGKKEPRLKIRRKIMIRHGRGRIDIFRNGKVTITAETIKELHRLKILTQIALRAASSWMEFGLSPGQEKNLRTGRTLPFRFYVEPSIGNFSIDGAICSRTMRRLLRIGYEPLLFLMHSTDLLDRYSELAAFSALASLELTLNELLPIERLGSWQKLSVLSFSRLLSKSRLRRLQKLLELRNKLAHGNWQGKKLSNNLQDVLGGSPESWLTPSRHMNIQASRKVVEEVLKAVSLLPVSSELN